MTHGGKYSTTTSGSSVGMEVGVRKIGREGVGTDSELVSDVGSSDGVTVGFRVGVLVGL